MTTPIVHVTDVGIMGTASVFAGVHHKDAVLFTGVQGFVRTVLSIFIFVCADNRRDVSTAFEAPVVQSAEHLFRAGELGLAVRECAIVVLQIECILF